MSKSRYMGSCHCGAIRFQAQLDLSGGVSRCNCSICMRTGIASLYGKPQDLELLTGEERITFYPPEGPARRVFCKRCGIHLYAVGDIPELGGPFLSVNANTLEGVDPWSLPVAFYDGRHNNWEAGPRPTPWPLQRSA